VYRLPVNSIRIFNAYGTRVRTTGVYGAVFGVFFKQKLSGKQIVELAKICVGIEKHYGFPCDIEWALEGDEFYIVQSRPITTLSNA